MFKRAVCQLMGVLSSSFLQGPAFPIRGLQIWHLGMLFSKVILHCHPCALTGSQTPVQEILMFVMRMWNMKRAICALTRFFRFWDSTSLQLGSKQQGSAPSDKM